MVCSTGDWGDGVACSAPYRATAQLEEPDSGLGQVLIGENVHEWDDDSIDDEEQGRPDEGSGFFRGIHHTVWVVIAIGVRN